MLRHFLRTTFLALSVTTLSFAASADSAQAQSFVEREQGRIKQLVDSNAPTAQVTGAINSIVDYQTIAEKALGKPCPATVRACTDHWSQLTPEQQREVVTLFQGLVEKKYRENAYKTKDFNVTYRGATEQTPEISKVKTEAMNKTKPRDPPVQVDYIVRCNPYPQCKLIDMVTEGSILSKNYYDQSHKMLTNDGYAYFVSKLREKIAGRTATAQTGQ